MAEMVKPLSEQALDPIRIESILDWAIALIWHLRHQAKLANQVLAKLRMCTKIRDEIPDASRQCLPCLHAQ